MTGLPGREKGMQQLWPKMYYFWLVCHPIPGQLHNHWHIQPRIQDSFVFYPPPKTKAGCPGTWVCLPWVYQNMRFGPPAHLCSHHLHKLYSGWGDWAPCVFCLMFFSTITASKKSWDLAGGSPGMLLTHLGLRGIARRSGVTRQWRDFLDSRAKKSVERWGHLRLNNPCASFQFFMWTIRISFNFM